VNSRPLSRLERLRHTHTSRAKILHTMKFRCLVGDACLAGMRGGQVWGNVALAHAGRRRSKRLLRVGRPGEEKRL